MPTSEALQYKADSTVIFNADPPKHKLDKVDPVVVNKQDDNSYAESVIENLNKEKPNERQEESDESSDEKNMADFEEEKPLNNSTNPNEAYL